MTHPRIASLLCSRADATLHRRWAKPPPARMGNWVSIGDDALCARGAERWPLACSHSIPSACRGGRRHAHLHSSVVRNIATSRSDQFVHRPVKGIFPKRPCETRVKAQWREPEHIPELPIGQTFLFVNPGFASCNSRQRVTV